jgi:MarR family transcriptional regulator, organic hydroperoxide resistance regulator
MLSKDEYIQINQAIFSIRNSYESRMNNEKEDIGLSIAEMGVIMVLGQTRVSKAKDLTKLMNITPGTISIYLTKLTGKGYVTQKRNDVDKRAWILQLTDQGEKTYKIICSGTIDYTKDIINSLSQSEQTEFHRLLIKIAHGNGYEWE